MEKIDIIILQDLKKNIIVVQRIFFFKVLKVRVNLLDLIKIL